VPASTTRPSGSFNILLFWCPTPAPRASVTPSDQGSVVQSWPRVATTLWDRQAGIHGHGGRPSGEFAALCGQLKVGWRFCEPADPHAKGVVERLQGYLETNFERGRHFANERDYQLQLDAWFEKANARTHKTLRCRRSTDSRRSATRWRHWARSRTSIGAG
jgi:hypothetical protein